MQLKVRASNLMDASTSPLMCVEDRLIRVPKAVRDQLGLELGAVLTLKGKTEAIYLQVYGAYAEDAKREADYAFVSRSTWDLLDVSHPNRICPAEEILIGCDPEMFIVDKESSRIVSAAHFFGPWGEIGHDSSLLEIRPRPSVDPKEVTKTIGELIKRAAMHLHNRRIFPRRELFLMAMSSLYGKPAGFHVHFGLPAYILKKDKERLWILINMVTILDYYVGILAILPEGSTDSARRSQKRVPYGKPGDFRAPEPNDVGQTFEYRVAGGHLLRHPIYTEGLLTTGKLVMEDMVARLEQMSNKDKRKMFFTNYNDLRAAIYPNLPERNAVCEALVSNGIDAALKYVEAIANDFAKMIGFDKYREIITDYIRLALDAVSGKVKISDDLVSNWEATTNESKRRQMAVL